MVVRPRIIVRSIIICFRSEAEANLGITSGLNGPYLIRGPPPIYSDMSHVLTKIEPH